jgi:hypothetical protein
MGLMDPTKIFYIVQMLKGYGKQGLDARLVFRLDARLPITLTILNRLLMAVPHCTALCRPVPISCDVCSSIRRIFARG